MKTFFIYSFFFIFVSLVSCKQSPNAQAELEKLQAEFTEKNKALESLQKEMKLMLEADNAPLVHLVFFDLKDEITPTQKTAFIKILKDLDSIEGVYNLEVGTFEDLGDERALSKYDVALQMEFSSADGYEKYQNDERHLKAKKALGGYLAEPPASYDFMER